MDILMQFLTNRVLISAILGWFLAQGTKMIIEIIKGGFSLKRLAGGGGMPSAHSATVTGLCVATALAEGPGSAAFAVALFLAIIVIYDARGVRFETGQQARALNRLNRKAVANGEDPLYEQDLEEHMGHTVAEIIAGMVVGVLAAMLVCVILFS